MGFNQIDFIYFIILFFFIFWRLKGRTRILFTLACNYLFYAWWDFRFLSLILLSTSIDYLVSLQLVKSGKPKAWLLLSLFSNIIILGFFKYFNFFIENLAILSESIGFQANLPTLSVIVPIGISFYSFQTISYTVDVYRGDTKPERNFIDFALFVSYFPQLVAGPIERAGDLIPQLKREAKFDYHEAKEGCKQVLSGFFKKVVIADQLHWLVSQYFMFPERYSGIELVFGLFLFAFQLYGDFSGYSDIAIGTARVFGVRLSDNFKFPFFSRSVRELFNRWHVSLGHWFRDYLYIPLGGNRVTRPVLVRNTFIIFAISGLWHGAGWTYIITLVFFGVCVMIPDGLGWKKTDMNEPVGFKHLHRVLFNFGIVLIAFMFFRADSMTDALLYGKSIITNSTKIGLKHTSEVLINLSILIPFIMIEWRQRFTKYFLDFNIKSKRLSLIFYSFLILLIIRQFGKDVDFIYFQF